MTDAILIYRERITEHLKTASRESLPTPLRQIDLLLAYRKYEDAAGLAEKLMELENQNQRFTEWHLEQGRTITELREQLAALREGAG